MLNTIKYQLLLLLIAIAVHTNAQKLPNKQEISVFAPTDIQIDGKSTEWGNQFKAYNSGTEIFYTLANDEKNIYLVIHATRSRIIEKIIEGGISFTINKGNQSDEAITVLFPLLSMNKARSILIVAGKKLSDESNSPAMKIIQPELASKQTTSIYNANKNLAESQLEIKVNGIASVIDTVAGITKKSKYYGDFPLHMHKFKVIGINNQDDIKAVSQFDDDGSYTYEVSFPIRYLELLPNAMQKIKYTITLNSRGEDSRFNDIINYSPPPNQQMLDLDLESDTYFSGEYILAKKPN